MDLEPYELAIPDAEIRDLAERLSRTRWPADLVDDWSRGTPVAEAKALVDRWLDGFDWRAQEARLNALPQFLAHVDGQPIHGFHVRSPRDDATPLLLCHGYPSNCVEFSRILADLADPMGGATGGATALHVVAPSIPGYGLSTPLVGTGWDIPRVAHAFDDVMLALGYDRFAVFGEDVGAGVAEQLCLDAGERVVGILGATDPGAIATEYTPPTDHLTDEEHRRHDAAKAARAEDFGYLALQTTRPLSVAFGLADSPVMQLTWMAEKFHEWTDPVGAPSAEGVDVDDLLALVSVSWFGGAGDGAANQLYDTAHSAAAWGRHHDRPQGITAFGDEPLMRRILNGDDHLTGWYEHPKGGHFPAMERPAELVGDLRAFFGSLQPA
ncbi:epoxide hydrolase family protein [Agromyces seonyuensis]|uniref:Alpha/beta fold hydrolase n=1 Tax=Agromyces seonyuensis TaxID=2662446 RepID=A0A6I4NWF6_9MICO|nr:epoxide hydrolase family protein [Agromyces seonyuensis]MWB98481.1 alpha/beta fold hydrolase [Agromyces seonyuensis]